MPEKLTKTVKSQDAERAQEKKERLKSPPVFMKALADESSPFPELLGVSAMEPPLEGHAAFLGDPRFYHSANNAQKAGLVTQLQQTHGNRYVQRLIQSMGVQTKLSVNSPDDICEREADRVADAVTRVPPHQIQHLAEEGIDYLPASSESSEVTVQRNPSDNQRWVAMQLLPIQRAPKVLGDIKGWFAKSLPKYFDKGVEWALETGEKAVRSKALKRVFRWARVVKLREIPKMIRDVRKASNPQEAIEEVLRRIAPGPWPLKGSRSPDEAMQDLEKEAKETVPEPARNKLLKLKDWLIEKLNIRKITEGLKGRV